MKNTYSKTNMVYNGEFRKGRTSPYDDTLIVGETYLVCSKPTEEGEIKFDVYEDDKSVLEINKLDRFTYFSPVK